MTRSALAAAFTLLVALAPAAGAPEDYAVKFERPTKAGARYHVFSSCASQQVSETRVGGQPLPAVGQAIEVDLHADVEVLAVTSKGREKKLRLTNTKISVVSKGATVSVFPDGTEVVVDYVGKKTTFKVGGRPASGPAKEALTLAVQLSPDESFDDLVFGTDQRQPVGQTWTLNTTAAAAALAVIVPGGTFRAEGIEGGCQISEIVQDETGTAMRLAGAIAVTNFQVPLPNQLKTRGGKVESRLTALLPLDPAKGPLRQISHTVIQILADGETSGKKLEIATKGTESRDVQYSYPKIQERRAQASKRTK